jgi:demethylmenaquinone methyltransferase / 2-methoxy-6-polyprenyl-1,4-benzoquinol methylase
MSIDKSGVGAMFDAIAWRYDFLNHFLTLGIDRLWRNKAVNLITAESGSTFLDVATGTGDLAVTLVRKKSPSKVVGIDISDGMLDFGRKKMEKCGLTSLITLQHGDCESLDFPDNTFEAVTVGFGIRNFLHPYKGLSEMHRVLDSGGEAIILEFSRPNSKLLCHLFDLYFCYVLPLIGKLFSRHSSAYTYLPDSVKEFPYGEGFAQMMRNAGFKSVEYHPLTFGIASIYKGVKN